MTWLQLRRLRQAVQISVFLVYVYLLFAALQRRLAFPLADLFFRLNPLAAGAAMLSSRLWIPRLALALVTLGLTLTLGRVWCGWLCPLGTILELVQLDREHSATVPPRWRNVKYVLLLAILALTLFGNLSLLVLDPITLLTRTMTVSVLPSLNYVVTSVERALYAVPLLRPAIDWVERALRGPVLPVVQPIFNLNTLVLGLFIGVLSLNALAERFWCRYLCPLGALLGLLSRASLLRPVVRAACNRCAHCITACHLDAIDTQDGYQIVPSECTVCLDCLAACPEGGMGFAVHRRLAPSQDYDPTRRQALTVLAGSAAAVALLRTGVRARRPHPQLIRPPGAQDEDEFLTRCIRCSQCMKVCPTSGLQPVLLEAGLEGVWSPMLVSRLGYCDYGCNACGQICPSGAIPKLDLPRKREQIIGLATIDRDRCLPWAQGVPCIVCEEMCPTSEKAIRLEETPVPDDRGEPVVVQRPYVLSDTCIGCGICEYQCPVEGEAAIKVFQA
jgi:polyferredoxin